MFLFSGVNRAILLQQSHQEAESHAEDPTLIKSKSKDQNLQDNKYEENFSNKT